MAPATGWILDVSVEQNRAIIWIKTSEGQILKLFDSYEPRFYILPKNEGAEIFQLLSHENSVRKVEWANKFTDLFDRQMKRLICIYPEPVIYHKTLRKLEKDPRVAEVFNTDLSHLQDYLFKLRIEPTSKIEVEYDDKSNLRKIKKLNDEDVVAPPPFSILHFDIEPSLDSDDIILEIRARPEGKEELLFEGEEGSILKEFCDYVQKEDPDILISRNKLLDHLMARMSLYGLDLGRECGTQGRVCLDCKLFPLPALIERARFGFITLGLAARYGMNRLIDGRNCYELIQRGFVIPSRDGNKNHEPIRTLEEIYVKDKGGMIFSPQVGLHENVVVLDYENEYANLILRHNLSYEKSEEKGLLPLVLENVLKRRIFFKNLQKSLTVNSMEWNWCEQRIDTLKNILVSLYGTSGSFWNRFANVETFEEINRLSREILIMTKDIVQENGFELLYADTDSVFLKKTGAPIEEYENVKKILAREIGIPISIEQYYKFLVLLPLEASERMEALKHYFGMTQSGEIIARGTEIRRHDAPNFVKEFQTELLYTLFDCEDSAEVTSKRYENALLTVTRTIDKIMTGEVQFQDLVVTKKLGQEIDKYRSLFPHVCAAIQLASEGKSTTVGEGVEYIYTDSRNSNPLCRVIPTALVGQIQHIDYDKEKYRDILLEAAETVLSIFGFDRTAYGDAPKKYKKWWQRLNEEKLRDRYTETT